MAGLPPTEPLPPVARPGPYPTVAAHPLEPVPRAQSSTSSASPATTRRKKPTAAANTGSGGGEVHNAPPQTNPADGSKPAD